MGIFISKTRNYPPWREEIKTVDFRQAVTAEFVATFIFLFSTIGCVVFTQDGGISTARQLEVSLIFGNAITILVFIFAGISGGNINPAVSWALMLTGKISPIRCALYTAAQCLGAICGTGFVRIMTPALFDKVDGGANEIAKNATGQEALGVEFGCTALLVLTVMAATDAHRADAQKHIPTIAPLVVGLAVTAAHFIAIPVDNCSINPARSFGVSAVSGNWNDHAVFWFGPYLGSTFAALLYYYLFAVHDTGKGAKPAASAAAATPAVEDHMSQPALTLHAPAHAAGAHASSGARFTGSSGGAGGGLAEATVDMGAVDASSMNQEWR